ncbi:unnamed protein product, partial [Tetraodon nigroviridis]
SGTELPAASVSAKPTGPAAPTELPTSSTVTPPKSVTPSPSDTSDSAVAAPSTNMLETLPAATDEHPVSAASPGLSAKLSDPEPRDVVPLVADGEAISSISVAPSAATSMSPVSATCSSITQVVKESVTTSAPTSGSLIPSPATATPPPPDAGSTITPDTPVASSSSVSTAIATTTTTTT